MLEAHEVLPRGPQPLLPSTGSTMSAIERRAMADALHRTRGNRRRAAAELGVPKSTFCEKVRRYGIKIDDG